MPTIDAPVATAQMLIRKPVAEVFNAIVDPSITTRFWFTKSNGRLEQDKTVRWDWEMYGVGTDVEVISIERNRRIAYDWNGPEQPTSVEWIFESLAPDRTFVRVKNSGFHGDANAVVRAAIGSAAGFSTVLAGMKAYLEHGIELNLIADHDPASLAQSA
jgi:uncharacterized protein YndB with AHSA1/START domain